MVNEVDTTAEERHEDLAEIVCVGDFVRMESTTFQEHGVDKGDELYIAGDVIVSVNEKDPYALRQVFIAAKVDENGHIDVNSGGFTVDGSRLSVISGERYNELAALKDYDFQELVQDEDGENGEGYVKSVN